MHKPKLFNFSSQRAGKMFDSFTALAFFNVSKVGQFCGIKQTHLRPIGQRCVVEVLIMQIRCCIAVLASILENRSVMQFIKDLITNCYFWIIKNILLFSLIFVGRWQYVGLNRLSGQLFSSFYNIMEIVWLLLTVFVLRSLDCLSPSTFICDFRNSSLKKKMNSLLIIFLPK